MKVEERWLAETTRRWKARDGFAPDDWVLTPPSGTMGGDVLTYAQDRLDLYEGGLVRLGVVLLAPDSTWEVGTVAAWAEVLFREGAETGAEVGALDRPSQLYWHVRQHGTDVPGLRSAVPFCRLGRKAYGVRRFPPVLSFGRVIQHGTLFVHPHALPGYCLRRMVLPVLVSPPGPRRMVMLLPHGFWAEDLRQRWVAS